MKLSNIFLSAIRTLVDFDEQAVAIAKKLAREDVVETVEELVDFINFNIEDGKFPMISKTFEEDVIRDAVEKARKDECEKTSQMSISEIHFSDDDVDNNSLHQGISTDKECFSITNKVQNTTRPITSVGSSQNLYEGKHLFYIVKVGRCIAKGFLASGTSCFYICKDSLVSKEEDSEYVGTISAKARKRFLDYVCQEEEHYYRVSKDVKCKTASAAACYVLGMSATYTAWVDVRGKCLEDFYPDLFSIGRKRASDNVRPSKNEKAKEHLFFLKQEPTRSRYCNASGYYDVTNEKFVLKSGSVLALEIAEQYKDSSFGNMREKFLSSHCDIKNGQYILRKDTVMNSPTMAASYVTGRIVKIRTVWKDSGGHTINDIYGKR